MYLVTALETGYGFTIIHFLVFQLLVVVEVVTSAVLYLWFDALGALRARAPYRQEIYYGDLERD